MKIADMVPTQDCEVPMSSVKTRRGRDVFSRVSGPLSVLLGSGLAILSGGAKLGPGVASDIETSSKIESNLVLPASNLPPKLVLKQVRTGFKLIAQHDSHDSHDSHASHDSHDSHDSHASHSSHTSGGYV
jgi:hypothetical protein